MIGTVDANSAHGTAHRGAVYVHRGETWLVRSLDLEENVAEIEAADPDYSTSAREITDITIVQEREHRRGASAGSRSGRSTSATRWCPSCVAGSRRAR